MKGRLFLGLFGTPFALVGIGFLFWSIIPTLYDGYSMQSWEPISAKLLSAKLDSHYSDGSSTYSVTAQYEYYFQGRRYTNNRVAINDASDNIGSFQEDLGRQLQQDYSQGGHIFVWVNPDSPAEAVINREIRWGLLAFKMIFVLVFGAVGIGLIIFAITSSHDDISEEAANDGRDDLQVQPWLTKKEWVGNHIFSNAKSGMWFFWGFATFWNLITLPFVFIIPQEVARGEYGVLFILIFNAVGIGLLIAAINKTRQWKRFGPTPLRLDPFPGSIGGHVGGEIQTNIPYAATNQFKVTLSNINSYVSGSGKNRSRKESIEWQDTALAQQRPDSNGCNLSFRFDVPEGLNTSQPHSNNYYLWRVSIHAELEGVDLDRDFEIPVYATSQESRYISDSVTDKSEQYHKEQASKALNTRRIVGGIAMDFPMGRNIGMAIGSLMFGAIFLGEGIFTGHQGYSDSDYFLYIFTLTFSPIGLGIMLWGLYLPLNSLSVTLMQTGITAHRRLLGLTLSHHQLSVGEIDKLAIKKTSSQQTGGKHTLFYKIEAHTHSGKKVTLAEGLTEHSTAEQAKALIEQHLPKLTLEL